MEILSFCISLIALTVALLTINKKNAEREVAYMNLMLKIIKCNDKEEKMKYVMQSEGTIVEKFDKVKEILFS